MDSGRKPLSPPAFAIARIDTGTAPTPGTVCRTLASHACGGNALAIGGVQQHDAGPFARRHALQRVAAPELDRMRHPGPLGIALREIHHPVRHIATKDERRIPIFKAIFASSACQHCIFSFVSDTLPHV
jgi:hypothetical protein